MRPFRGRIFEAFLFTCISTYFLYRCSTALLRDQRCGHTTEKVSIIPDTYQWLHDRTRCSTTKARFNSHHAAPPVHQTITYKHTHSIIDPLLIPPRGKSSTKMALRPGFTVLAFHHARAASVCSELSIDEDEEFEVEVEDPLLLGLSSSAGGHRRTPSDDDELLLFPERSDAGEVKRPRLYTCTSPDIRPFLDRVERKLSSAFLDKLAQSDEYHQADGQERPIACETSSMMLVSDPLDGSGPDSMQMMSLHKISGLFEPIDGDSNSIATSLTSAISSMNQTNSGVSFMLLPPVNRRAHMHRRVSYNSLPTYDMILSSFSSSRFCLDDLTESSPSETRPSRDDDEEEELPHLLQFSFSTTACEEPLRQVSSSDDSEERDAPTTTSSLKRHHRCSANRILM